MRCREFGRRRRLPRSKIADAPAGIRSPTKKSLRKQSRAGVQVFNHLGIECWGFIILGPLFIISLLTAGVTLPAVPAPVPVPHQKKFKKTKSCWGPLFIILIKRAGAGSRSVQVFNHLV